jgi:outer membrane protein TolC
LLPGLYKGATIPGEIPLRLPAADELMSVGAGLPAIKLEASFNQPISLRDTLIFAAANNLPINIARENQINSKWLLVAQAAGSLPDVILNYTQQILQGQTLVQGVIPTSFHTPNVTMNAGFRVWGSKGGAVVFGTMAALHNYKAVKAGLRTTISDQFLALASGYYNLVLQQALMQVQVRAVATSRAQVDLNTKLERAGTGTRFNVLQSETQLATDEQNLLNQEVAFRRAAINLAALLNLNMSVNLMTVESDVRKVRLVDPSLAINDLLRIAIDHRPELKQYEQLRLAAKRQIQVAAAPLYPQMNFFGTVTGSGATLTDTYRIVPGQIQIVPISGPPPAGTPFNKNVSQPLFPVAAVQTQPQVQQRYVRPSYALGINMTWNHLSLNVPTMANVMAARTQARIAMLNSNQQLINVIQQVRTAYINSLLAERQVDVTSTAVVSSSEQLRLARVRLENGVGTNLDVITAQQAYTQALINKANAILAFNITQAQLIHDVGMTSVETLTSGRLLKRD